MSLLVAIVMLGGCFAFTSPVKLLAATTDVNALNITLDSNVGEIADGKIKVQSVTGGSGGPLYFVIDTTEGTAPAPNTPISTIAGNSALVLNTEIGMTLSYKNYLRVYETDATGFITGYASMPIPWNMIGTVLYRGNWTSIAKSTVMTFGSDTWKNYTIDATITNLGPVSTGNANLMLFFRHTGAPNTSGNCFYLIQTQGLIAFQSYPYNFDAYPGTGQTAIGVPNRVRIVVDGNNNQFWSTGSNGVNGTLVKRVDKTIDPVKNPTWVRPAGKVGFKAENCTGNIENYVVRRITKAGEDPYATNKTLITNPMVNTINAPQAGNYPQSLYNYPIGSGANAFNETIVWSPAITSTFNTNTVYTATLTLTPVQATSTFQGAKLSDIIGLPASGYTSMTADMFGDAMIIKIVFNATGSEIVPAKELFKDDFNGTSLDTTKWNNAPGWDRQGRSTWDGSLVKVDNGNLVLGFQKDPVLGATKSTDPTTANNWMRAGAVRTRTTDGSSLIFGNSYGYYESRIKFPKVTGMWGAFWLMSPTQTANPANGVYGSEIDILESIANPNNGFNGALYWNGYGGSTSGSTGSGTKLADKIGINIYDGNFHTFGLEWTPTQYIWYVDDVEFYRYTNSGNICQNPDYIKLSLESASWSPPLAADSGEMDVDYVAVYNQPKHQIDNQKAEDFVTLHVDPVYNTTRDLWQIKATLKNIKTAGAYSGSVTLTSPSGYATQTVQNYPELSPGQEYTLYFDMNRNYVPSSAKDTVTFNYTTSNSGTGTASVQMGSVPATYTNTPVVVDGDLNDAIWQTASGINFSKGVSLATNASATGQLAWDNQYLYTAVKVADDTHVQTATDAADIANGDSLQLMVDGQNLGFAKSGSNTLQYKFSGTAGVIPADQANIAIIRDEQTKTTTYEIAIKWSYLNIDGGALKNGDLHNIAMVINDNNDTGKGTISYFDGIRTNDGQGQGSLLLLDHVVLPRYMVTFNSNGGWSIPQIEMISGSKIAKPFDPKRVYGYTFAGWYKDQNCTQMWNFDTDTVTADTTLYAKWDRTFTVTFNSNGGSAVAPAINVVPGSVITVPAAPTRAGYVFGGWCSDAGLATAWNFSTGQVNANITLYAKWSMDGSKVPAQTTLSLKPVNRVGVWQVEATVKNTQASGNYSGQVYSASIDGNAKNYGPLAPGEEVKLYFDIAAEHLSDTLIFDYTATDGSGTEGIGSASTSFVSALYTNTPIDPDGNLNKGVWQAAPTIDFGKARINSDSLAGNQPMSGNYEIGATGKLAWDKDYLYVALQVNSENNYQIATTGDGIWAYDSLQLRLRQGAAGSTELGFALSSNTNQVFQWCWAGPNAGKAIPADMGKTVIIRDENTHTTSYEIAVKWAFMGIDGKNIQNNDLLGVCLALNDYGSKISGSSIVSGRRQITYFDGILGTKDAGLGNLLLSNPIKLDKVTLSADKTALRPGDTALLSISGTMSDGSPADLSQTQVAYGSDNEQVAIVDANGTVTGVAEGTADIKASVTLHGITKEGSIQIIVDSTPPVTAAKVDGTEKNGWYSSDATVTLSATDNLSGADRTEYRMGDSGDWTAYTGPVVMGQEGTCTLQYRSIDKAGNVEDVKQQTVQIDKTLPAFELTVNGNALKEGDSFEDFLPLTFKVWDDLSGVASAKLTIDGTDYSIDPKTLSSMDIDLAGKVGSWTANVQVQDIAGNTLEKTFQFTVTTSIGSMRQLTDRYVKAGGLGGPLTAQLNNNLDQAQHQLDIGRPDQAAKHMEDFVKHLNNAALGSNVNDNVKAVLNADAGVLIKMWAAVNQ